MTNTSTPAISKFRIDESGLAINYGECFRDVDDGQIWIYVGKVKNNAGDMFVFTAADKFYEWRVAYLETLLKKFPDLIPRAGAIVTEKKIFTAEEMAKLLESKQKYNVQGFKVEGDAKFVITQDRMKKFAVYMGSKHVTEQDVAAMGTKLDWKEAQQHFPHFIKEEDDYRK